MMNLNSNISMSINLVRKELEATLLKAENYFALYAEDKDPVKLKLFADELNLARGTFKLLELSGPEVIATEMLSLVGDGAVSFSKKADALSVGLIGLSHYIGLLLDQERDYPVLLIPTINIIRKAANHKPLLESHFFSVNLRPKLPDIEKSNIILKSHLPRIRLMFQVGLLRVLNDADPMVGFKLIARALDLLERGFRGSLAWSFWWCCKGAVEAIVEERYELTSARKLLFARIDLVMRLMIKDGVKVFTSSSVNELQKDLLHLVSLSGSESGVIKSIQECYLLKSNVLEKNLKIDRALLNGPDIAAFDSLAGAFKEEIELIKGALDLSAKGALTQDGLDQLENRLGLLADVLKVINQPVLSEKLKQQQASVSALAAQSEHQKVEALASIADVLLQVDLASNNLSHSQQMQDAHEIIGAGHYYEARIVLFDEIGSGLAMAKRAISSFMESADKLHVANISQALSGVRGALIFLNEIRAAEVIAATMKYLNDKLLTSDTEVNEAHLEVLADALTSIEYFAETSFQSDKANADLLNLAVKSMAQLGYKVS